MPSDTETIKQEKVEKPFFRMIIDTPANETEQKSFWNQLRRFYRTGEKHAKTKNIKLRSAFTKLPELQNDERFPFRMDDQDFDFNYQLPFEILNGHISDYQNIITKDFKLKIQGIIDGLKKQLEVKDHQENTGDVYDFASEIIAFEKLSGFVPMKEGDQLTPARSKQLIALLDDLKEGLQSYEKEAAVILEAAKALKTDKSFDKVKVIEVEEINAFQYAEKELKIQMKRFIHLIRSLRIAELEINGEYKEEIHQDFYEHFSWYRLTEAEKSLFHPVILIIDHGYLMSQLDAYTRLLSHNWPIKLVVLNHGLVSEPDGKTDWEEASHRFRQELSAFTISHRNVFVFQSTFNNPNVLSEGLGKFVKTNNPAIAHLLIPKENKTEDLMASRAAVLGRHFPVITYDPSVDEKRLQLNGNDYVTGNWPEYEITYTADDEHIEKLKTEFTYADYKACFEEKVDELMIVPPSHDSKDLVSLPEYLSLKEDELVGRLPFIWLADQKGDLSKAVVPNVWVVSCQERLDFWNFLQELGNVKGQVQDVVADEQHVKESESPASDKMTALRAAHEHELKKVREEAVSQAAGQLLQVLLNGEDAAKG